MRARGLAAAAALALLTGCGGGDPPSPVASSSAPVSPTASVKPKPKPKPKPTKTAAPSPTPTTPPPATGEPVGTAEAMLHLVEPGEPKAGDNCAAMIPEYTEPACRALKAAGGSLVVATGRLDGAKAIRLLVQTRDGYVARYEGRDDGRWWRSLTVYAAPLTGQGDDGIVFFVRLTDGAATYDVLTWVKGGPLVLRAHRPPLADGRLAAAGGALEEYERAVDGSFVKRRLAWDGRRFLLSSGVRSTTPPPR